MEIDLIVKERLLATCSMPPELFLRERAVAELSELGKLVEQYENPHGTTPKLRERN